MKGRLRKDVDLTPKTIKELQKLANKDKRKLKPYMEKVLEEKLEINNQTDINHLEFIYQRLINKHNEDINVDYMIKFRAIINSL